MGWLSRDSYGNPAERYEEVRIANQLWGCLTPVGRILSLMVMGKSIARKRGADQGAVTWQDGNRAIKVMKCMPFSLSKFKSSVRSLYDETRKRLNQLFFGAPPELDISKLADCNWSEKCVRYSILEVEAEANRQLRDGGLAYMLPFLKRAGLMEQDGVTWNHTNVDEYLDNANEYFTLSPSRVG